jgi:hypothetical protein
MSAATADRATLRARLSELNLELKVLSPLSDPSAPVSEDLAGAPSDGRDT